MEEDIIFEYENYSQVIDEATNHLDLSDEYKEKRDRELHQEANILRDKMFQDTRDILDKISQDWLTRKRY